ncbi:pyridoxamine 5'-phosphate oxidase family protein [Kibdelosporangium philippinense]
MSSRRLGTFDSVAAAGEQARSCQAGSSSRLGVRSDSADAQPVRALGRRNWGWVIVDSAGLELLSGQECFRLLAKVPVGRVVYTDRALPAVQPVTFTLLEQTVIIRTSAHSRLAHAATGKVVAFEADEFKDTGVRSGWSVVAIGHAVKVTDPTELDAVKQLGLRAWTQDAEDCYLRISVEIVSGRRLPT